jgi:hypothetical protein
MSVNGIGGTRGIGDFDVKPSTAPSSGAAPAEGAVVRGSAGPARPDPARAATERHLASLDRGLATFNDVVGSGATPRARETLKTLDREVKVRFWNMRIDDGEKQRAFDAMRGLSNREFLACLYQMGWTMQSGGAERGGWAMSRFLFEPKFKAETERRLRAIEQEFRAATPDPVAAQFCIDTLRTQVANVFSK